MKTNKRLKITLDLAKKLIKEQFPEWSQMEIKLVKFNGWDNTTFHLGKEMLIRMPSAECYTVTILKEQKWLKILKPYLSLTIPEPIALGKPSNLYPWNWSIFKWIEGETTNSLIVNDLLLKNMAIQFANFLNELHLVPIDNAPTPSIDNFWRGGSLSVYEAQTISCFKKFSNLVNIKDAQKIWNQALKSKWTKPPVWVHGDLALGNFLIKDNDVTAIIDFEGIAVGDPACDLILAWTLLDKTNRKIFKTKLNDLDEETWNRAKGWALWKSLITIEKYQGKDNLEIIKQQKIINEIIDCKI